MKKMFLQLKYRKILSEMAQLEISDIALENYISCVRNNAFEEIDVLVKKLKRNFVLGEKINDYTSKYGNLYIFFKGKKITKIFNEKGVTSNFSVNKKLKSDLDYILGI